VPAPPRDILSNLTFAAASGLRAHEVCMLDVTHINRERQELLVLTAKGDRPRAVPIPEVVYTELLAYLLERGKRGPLFRTNQRQRRRKNAEKWDRHDISDW